MNDPRAIRMYLFRARLRCSNRTRYRRHVLSPHIFADRWRRTRASRADTAGAQARWEMREQDETSSIHLPTSANERSGSMTAPVRRASVHLPSALSKAVSSPVRAGSWSLASSMTSLATAEVMMREGTPTSINSRPTRTVTRLNSGRRRRGCSSSNPGSLRDLLTCDDASCPSDVIEDSSQTRVISSELRYPSPWQHIHALGARTNPVQKVPSRDGATCSWREVS